MQASNRIIVNTAAQYIRTILNLVLSLYSSRLVLQILGVDDYGIYSLVAGLVSMLSFFTNSLVSSTQRFLSICQGRNNITALKKVFSNSLLIHIILGIIIFFILESLSPFLFNGFLNIPYGRESSAIVLYQQVLLMVYISFVTSPYRALLVSRENIVYTSFIDVVDGVLKVLLVLLLPILSTDMLEAYGWIMLSISCFNFLAFAVYSHLKYEECILPRFRLFEWSYVKDLFQFTGWITYSTACITLRMQGVAIILNRMMGPVINAAFGIGSQINSMVGFLCTSINNAIAPQLMSAEGGNNRDRMWYFSKISSKFAFLLLSMVGIPVMFEMHFLLDLWLVEVPQNTILFACTFLIMQIIDQLTIGLLMAKKAIGKIGFFSFVTYTPKLLILPIGWYVFHIGGNLETLCLIFIIVELLCMIIRIPLLRHEDGFNPSEYIADVFIRPFMPVLMSIMICFIFNNWFNEGWLRLILTFLVSIGCFISFTYYFSLTRSEKDKVWMILSKMYRR